MKPSKMHCFIQVERITVQEGHDCFILTVILLLSGNWIVSIVLKNTSFAA